VVGVMKVTWKYRVIGPLSAWAPLNSLEIKNICLPDLIQSNNCGLGGSPKQLESLSSPTGNYSSRYRRLIPRPFQCP
jgi:hypothetical protein